MTNVEISSSPLPERTVRLALDIAERILFVLMFAGFAAAFLTSAAKHPANYVALVSESMLCLFILIRPLGAAMTTRPLDWVAAFAGTMLPLLIRPGGVPIAPRAVAASLMCIGVIIALWAQITLRTRFGIAPANRGVVERGPYGLVRHPMYAGYFITQVGIILANPSATNVLIVVVATAFQIARIRAEERFFLGDPAYTALTARVKYRLVPGLF
jgi:protein-S-isoprenylcysteine O-methyltransferase Ste14